MSLIPFTQFIMAISLYYLNIRIQLEILLRIGYHDTKILSIYINRVLPTCMLAGVENIEPASSGIGIRSSIVIRSIYSHCLRTYVE